MRLIYIGFLMFFIKTTKLSVYTNQRKNILSFTQWPEHNDQIRDIEPTVEEKALKKFLSLRENVSDTKNAKEKAKILQRIRAHEHHLNGADVRTPDITFNDKQNKQQFLMDPVLNQLRRQMGMISHKRKVSTSLESSSLESQDWKKEFSEYWKEKQFEAVNSTDFRGDVVNMVAARPWGVPCGDPNQYDVPWGSCMLPMECDAEFRIYRGDYLCGNTQFVCCALQPSTYDLNQAFDISFVDSNYETDSEEKKARGITSKELNKRQRERIRRKRQKERKKKKRQMKESIRRIVSEIRKILTRSYRNTSEHRKRRTKLLKRYIKDLKKQYTKDRKSVREIHREDMIAVDAALKKRLDQIRDLNRDFLLNSTFRDIVINGTMSKKGARMLVEAYPELMDILRSSLRRYGGGVADNEGSNDRVDYLDYDIEYGALFY